MFAQACKIATAVIAATSSNEKVILFITAPSVAFFSFFRQPCLGRASGGTKGRVRCVASPPSQSPIGVVKRNHALNLASRIKNAYLSCTKSSAGFRGANCLIFLKKHRFNAG